MGNLAEKMAEFVSLLVRHTPREGINWTGIPDVGAFRQTRRDDECTAVYEPALLIVGQGQKRCYVDGKAYDYRAGRYLCLFLPMPVEVEVVEATPEEPLLMAGIRMDLPRIANMLLKMDRVKPPPAKAEAVSSSAIIAEPLTEQLLDAIIRLLRTLDNPVESAVLSDAILDEIYFRLLAHDRTGSLRRLLAHRGQVQQISKAVEHIHQNLHEVVSVDELADIASMSASGFRKMFKEVMHLPPLQYAKALKLDRARTLLKEGKNASEAGYLVGYNSPAQFSREYKRQFGVSPSATLAV
ncbi:MAG: AraC family transcriptional regulator [Caldilineaceae bacterium]